MRFFCLLLFLVPALASGNGTLTANIRITSTVLGYDLQYRAWLPEDVAMQSGLPVLFVTDGPGYINQGRMPTVLNRLTNTGKIGPLITIFVDARDPDRPRTNRRNQQFLCNRDYLRFYVEELIPAIEQTWPVAKARDSRAILGLSFGATNAACFGLLGYESFSLIGMHSPANHPVPELLPAYEKMPLLPLKIFLSTGKPNDNTQANRKFREVLRDKGYPMKYMEVRKGHNWENWRPLVDDVLLYFYGSEDP